MSARLLLDTNVWLDYFTQTRPGHVVAEDLIRQSVKQGAGLFYALGSSKDLYYLVRALSKRLLRDQSGTLDEAAALAAEGMAWDCVCALRTLATCVGADESDLWLAEKSHGIHRDYEDDLVIAAAQRIEADALVTSDEALLRHAPVAALTPRDALRFYGA